MAETPDPQSPFDPTRPPSSSLLFHLYADRVAPAARRGTQAPLANTHVDTSQLAYALFAVAVWQLRESGLVRLEVVQERKMFKSNTHLRITRASVGGDGQRNGIEAGLLDVLTPGSRGKLTPAWEALPEWVRGQADRAERMRATFANLPNRPNFPTPPQASGTAVPETVTDVVIRWYGSHVRDPESLPITWTEREGIAKGYLTEATAQRNPVAAVFLGLTTLVPQRERIAALEPAFAQLLARWQAFNANEVELAGHLVHAVVAGINARRDTSDTGSFT